jgi:hypothetical protein
MECSRRLKPASDYERRFIQTCSNEDCAATSQAEACGYTVRSKGTRGLVPYALQFQHDVPFGLQIEDIMIDSPVYFFYTS